MRLTFDKEPSFKCEGTLLNDYTLGYSESITNPMYVGTLTADEVTFAGAYSTNVNTNYYLVNGSEYFWWTISPSHFDSSSSYAYFVSNDGYVGSGDVSYGAALRPSVNLKAGTSINGGEGTKTNPYVITN